MNIEGGLHGLQKQDLIENKILEENPSVFHIIESCISKTDTIPDLCPLFYDNFSRNKHRMVTYYRKDIGLTPLDLPFDLDCPCHILQGREITLAGIYGEYTKYNPDGSSWKPNPKERMRNLINTIRYIHSVSKRILIIFGDFNFNWREKNTPEMRFYLKTLQTLGLSQMINNVTHPNQGHNGKIIDHILQRNAEGNYFVQPMGIGDHFSVNYCNGKKKENRQSTTH